MAEDQQALEIPQDTPEADPSTAEIFQRAKDAVDIFVTEQSQDNNGLLDIWDKKIQAALAQQTIVDSSEEKNWPDFRFDEWNEQVRESINIVMISSNRENSNTSGEMSALTPEDPDHVDLVYGIGDGLRRIYDVHRSQLSDDLSDTWARISNVAYVNMFPEGSSDREKLIIFVNTLEFFKNEQIIGDNPDGWGRKLVNRLEQMMNTLEETRREKNQLLMA